MKLRLLAAVAVLAVVGAFGGLFGGNVAEAACPPPANGGCAQDHTWTVGLSSYAASSPTNVTVNLTLGTNTAATSPFPTAFFNEATAMYSGITPGAFVASGVGAQVGTIDFSIQSNVDPSLIGSNNINLTTGQPPRCGAPGTLALGSPTPIHAVIYTAVRNTTTSPVPATVSSGPDASHPPYTFDQEPDFAAGGVPMGVTHNPDWYPTLLTQIGVPDSIVTRGYAIAKTTAASQTTVSFLTIAAGAQTINVTVLGNPIAVFNPAGQAISTCPPFSSSVLTQGTTTAHNWNCTNDYFGTALSVSWPSNPCSGSTNGTSNPGQTVTATPGTYDYQIALSSGLNLDGDQTGGGVQLWDQWDNCPVDANPTQSDANSNGIGDACKAGGTVWTNVSAGAVTNAGITCAPGAATAVSPFAPCQDADGDGVLNAVDNCPLTPNPLQTSTLRDGIGDACRPGMAGNLAVTTDVPGTGVGYPTEYAAQDLCGQEFTVGGTSLAPYCVANGTGMPGGVGVAFKDSNYDRTPDFMASFTKPSGAVAPCVQDHVSDTNHDGYSDADEGTPNPAPSCPANPNPNDNLYPASGGIAGGNALAACAGRNLGTSTSPATAAQVKGAKIAKADVDLNGRVNILDLSAAAGAYNQSGFSLDPSDKRNEYDQDGNGRINILDLSAMAGFYNQLVPPC